jgi:hypothetical protein
MELRSRESTAGWRFPGKSTAGGLFVRLLGGLVEIGNIDSERRRQGNLMILFLHQNFPDMFRRRKLP